MRDARRSANRPRCPAGQPAQIASVTGIHPHNKPAVGIGSGRGNRCNDRCNRTLHVGPGLGRGKRAIIAIGSSASSAASAALAAVLSAPAAVSVAAAIPPFTSVPVTLVPIAALAH